jgi:hypothetical protein
VNDQGKIGREITGDALLVDGGKLFGTSRLEIDVRGIQGNFAQKLNPKLMARLKTGSADALVRVRRMRKS